MTDRTIETGGDTVRVCCPYDDEVLEVMRDMGLSGYWHQPSRAYLVPEEEFTNDVLVRLERLGFEVQ